MIWYRLTAALAILPWLILAWAAAVHKPIEAELSPRFGMAGGTLKLMIRIEPDPQARIVAWSIEGEDYYRSGQQQIAVTDLPTRWVEFKNLPAGHYIAQAAVIRADASHSESEVVEACLSGMNVHCASAD